MAASPVGRSSRAIVVAVAALAGACVRQLPARPGADVGAGAAGSLGSGGGSPGGGSPDAGPSQVTPRLTAGPAHACLIDEAGALWCWGNNAFGQLGDGTRDDRAAPVRVGGDSDWVAIAAGGEGCTTDYCTPSGEHTCGIRRDGSLWCWGTNAAGELGDGTTDTRLQPTRVGDATDWTAVATGWSATCGVRAGAGLWCWGGVVWDGSYRPPVPLGVTRPIQVDGATDWIQIALGRDPFVTTPGLACGVRASGELWCWTESHFVLPDATRTPRRMGFVSDWTAVSVGKSPTGELCVTRSDGSLACGATTCDAKACGLAAVTVTPAARWGPSSASMTHTCAVGDGRLRCWGSNAFGALGAPPPTVSSDTGIPGEDWDMVAAGDAFTCAHKRDRSTYCWGRNLSGELGLGVPANKQRPARVDDQRWLSVAGGNAWTVAVRDDGSLWKWGQGHDVPVKVGLDTDWAAVSGTVFHVCGIRRDGALWCWYPWGDIRVPTQIGKAAAWTEISVARGGACGVRAGTLVCFSDNKGAPAGQDVQHQIAVSGVQPEPIGTDGWLHVATADEHACGVRADGTLWCWGAFGRNQDGTAIASDVPIPLGAGGGWASVALAGADGCGVRSDGSLACWTLSVERAPAPGDVLPVTVRSVGADRTWSSVFARASLACAIDAAGGLRCWSYRDDAWAGVFTPAGFGPEAASAGVTHDAAWNQAALGSDHACAIDAAAALWCWGSNRYGQIGDGSAWRYETSAPVAFP